MANLTRAQKNELTADQIKQDEKLGRDKFTVLNNKLKLAIYRESKERFSAWDISAHKKNSKGLKRAFIIEIKNREIPSNLYPTLFLEVQKYQRLIETKDKVVDREPEAELLYINFLTDNKVVVFNLSKIDLTKVAITKRYAKCDDYDLEARCLKDMYELPIELGTTYEI